MKCAARGLICRVRTRYSASDEKEKWKKNPPYEQLPGCCSQSLVWAGSSAQVPVQGKEWSQSRAPPGSLIPTASKKDFFHRVNGSAWQQEPGQSTALFCSGFREALSGGEETGKGHSPLPSSEASFRQTSKSRPPLPAALSVPGSSCRPEFYMHQSTRVGYWKDLPFPTSLPWKSSTAVAAKPGHTHISQAFRHPGAPPCWEFVGLLWIWHLWGSCWWETHLQEQFCKGDLICFQSADRFRELVIACEDWNHLFPDVCY